MFWGLTSQLQSVYPSDPGLKLCAQSPESWSQKGVICDSWKDSTVICHLTSPVFKDQLAIVWMYYNLICWRADYLVVRRNLRKHSNSDLVRYTGQKTEVIT